MKYIFKCFFLSIISCFLAWGVYLLLGESKSGNLAGFNSNTYLKHYYSYINKRHPSNAANSNIVIFSIENYKSRIELSKVLDTIIALNPRVIALDIFISDNNDISDYANSRLLQSLSKCPSKIVMPIKVRYDEASKIAECQYPYFFQHPEILDIEYAFPFSQDFYSQYISIDSLYSKHEMFSYAIAKKYNPKINIDSDIYVNYVSKQLYSCSKIEELYPELIRDKIVIIGDCSNRKDFMTSEFEIEGQYFFPGTKNIAYAVNTLLSTSTYTDSESEYLRPLPFANQPIKECHSITNYLYAILLTFLYTLLFSKAHCCKETLKERIQEKFTLLSCFKYVIIGVIGITLILFVSEWALIWISFQITYLFNQIPKLLFFMLSVLILTSIYEPLDVIFTKLIKNHE